jgi:hypothetical protein
VAAAAARGPSPTKSKTFRVRATVRTVRSPAVQASPTRTRTLSEAASAHQPGAWAHRRRHSRGGLDRRAERIEVGDPDPSMPPP